MLNVILPCAGEGTRLGLPYPKEMHHVGNGMSLVDLSLQLMYPHRQLVNRVTITLTGKKAQLVHHFAKWRAIFPFVFTYFDERFDEWPGSILSAEPLFMDRNVVLLPDSFIREDAKFAVIPTFDRLLNDHDLVFGVKREGPERLRDLGAVRLEEDGRISEFCDKPSADLDKFNGFWGCFGFTGVAGRQILEMMTASVRRQPVSFDALCLRGPIGFPLQDYQDLGVWGHLNLAVTSGAIPSSPLQHRV